jgi:hypothetical protein
MLVLVAMMLVLVAMMLVLVALMLVLVAMMLVLVEMMLVLVAMMLVLVPYFTAPVLTSAETFWKSFDLSKIKSLQSGQKSMKLAFFISRQYHQPTMRMENTCKVRHMPSFGQSPLSMLQCERPLPHASLSTLSGF